MSRISDFITFLKIFSMAYQVFQILALNRCFTIKTQQWNLESNREIEWNREIKRFYAVKSSNWTFLLNILYRVFSSKCSKTKSHFQLSQQSYIWYTWYRNCFFFIWSWMYKVTNVSLFWLCHFFHMTYGRFGKQTKNSV